MTTMHANDTGHGLKPAILAMIGATLLFAAIGVGAVMMQRKGSPRSASTAPLASAEREGLQWDLDNVCDYLHGRGIAFSANRIDAVVHLFARDGVNGSAQIAQYANANEATEYATHGPLGGKAWGRFVIRTSGDSPFYREVLVQFP